MVEEAETFQQQALEIRQPDDDFDPNAEPQNGEEFLMRMMYERKRCPAVVVVRPPKQETLTTTTCIETDKDMTAVTSSASLLPTIEWKELQAADFLATRDKISSLRLHLNAHNYNNALEPPLTTEPEAWQEFCRQNPPLLRTILRINQRTLEQLLDLLSEWLQCGADAPPEQESLSAFSSSSSSSAAAATATAAATTFDLSSSDQWLGSWLYASLACLHLPLEPDVHSTLRDIARTCLRLRSRLLPQELEKAVPYNLFVYLIAKVFGQLDFAEFV